MDKVKDRVMCTKLCVGDAGLTLLPMVTCMCYYVLPGTTSSIQMCASTYFLVTLVVVVHTDTILPSQPLSKY